METVVIHEPPTCRPWTQADITIITAANIQSHVPPVLLARMANMPTEVRLLQSAAAFRAPCEVCAAAGHEAAARGVVYAGGYAIFTCTGPCVRGVAVLCHKDTIATFPAGPVWETWRVLRGVLLTTRAPTGVT